MSNLNTSGLPTYSDSYAETQELKRGFARFRLEKNLQPPDSHHLRAIEGWLELGNHTEASQELEKITPELRVHPCVLEASWQIYAAAKEWDAALDIAAALIQLVPDCAFGWLHRSFCLHKLKRTLDARDSLLPVVDKFADEYLIRYNLACYECQLGRLEQAKEWLWKAFEVGGARKIKLLTLDHPDLEPLWKEFGRPRR